ncbi:MAG: hypothetical protein J6S23_01410 [Clostridia bacterium]|nr:hypothetical protein [Clostridia bacterium]
MNFKLRLLALLLLVMMVFTSCSLESIMQYIPFLGGDVEESTTTTTTTTKPTTTKPTTVKPPVEDVPEFDVSKNQTSKSELEASYTLTQEEVDAVLANLDKMVELSLTAETSDEVDALYEEFETAYYHIAQQMTISMILYYYDMLDETAKERYLNTTDMFYSIEDKYNLALKDMYQKSPIADQIFEGWTEEELKSLEEYDPAVTQLQKEIDALQVEYDQLSQSDANYNSRCIEIYKQLIVKNNALARLNGYDNYYDYAAANVYERDYEREELALFRQYLVEYVVPAYNDVHNYSMSYESWTSKTKKARVDEFLKEPFYANPKRNYLVQYLDSLEGTMGDSMRHVFENKNCIFSYSTNSHPTAFKTFLYEDKVPFCFFGSDGQSASTVVHEIGHYYAGLVNNDLDNFDLCETHSQGNEYLFLTYCKDLLTEDVYSVVRANGLADALRIMIIATVIDEFEQNVYLLDDATVNAMTSEDFDAIMEKVCEQYGGDDWVKMVTNPYAYWRLVCISNPVYYISYAVSATAAINILALAEEDYDAALVAYTTLAEGVTPEDGFLGALTKAGLTTPFDEETFIKIAEVLNK